MNRIDMKTLVVVVAMMIAVGCSRPAAEKAASGNSEGGRIASEDVVEATPQSIAAVRGSVMQALQSALESDQLEALQAACGEALPELKGALRPLLHYHLGSPVLRTRQLMMELPHK